MRKQTAVYWRRTTADRYGSFSYATPLEISCRWEDRVEEVTTALNEKKLARSVVYVDRVMYPGDKLMLGEQESDTPDDPDALPGAYEIMRFDQLPNLRNTETLYTAYL
tara:strand:- start:43868 stop:44191 length:324 start_codon:yes stop_codon:yes gene_type:complete